MAGVDIDLIVRDICRLRPGLEEVSETIDVYSIVGRFLEHSRIFYFENDGDSEYYIGSADWMTRNLDNRIEAVTPIDDPDLRTELEHILTLNLEDNYKRWRMHADGSYEQCRPEGDGPVYNTQQRLMQRAREAIAEHRHDPPNGNDPRQRPFETDPNDGFGSLIGDEE